MTEFELLDPAGLIQLRKWIRQQRVRLLARSMFTPFLLAMTAPLGHALGSELAPYFFTRDPSDLPKISTQPELQALIDSCQARLADTSTSTKLQSHRLGQPMGPQIETPSAANSFLSIPNRLIDSNGRGWSFNPENLQWQPESP